MPVRPKKLPIGQWLDLTENATHNRFLALKNTQYLLPGEQKHQEEEHHLCYQNVNKESDQWKGFIINTKSTSN